MSKTISISKNDGTTFAETVIKLRTNSADGGSIEWVPDDETRCESLNVTANGTYAAASAGKYGYDYVTVSVKGGSATGIGPDGNEHTVTIDPETGMLVDEVTPSSIVVTTPPTVTTYQDGGTIDFTGIVVTAYTLDGEVWEDSSHPGGIIPVSELEFPVTTADYDPFSMIGEYSGDTSGWAYPDIKQVPVGRTAKVVFDANGQHYDALITSSADAYVVLTLFDEGSACMATVYSTTLNAAYQIVYTVYYESGQSDTWTINRNCGTHNTTYQSTDYYYNTDSFIVYKSANIGVSTIPSTADGQTQTATILFDGSVGCVQEIPVNWQRPGDGAVLETTFEILVGPTGGSGED